jgi:hypothetical protein
MTKEIPPPFVVVPVAMATVALVVLLSYVAGPVPGEQEIAAQIEREDSSLCGKLGFAVGTRQGGECRADLADLRRRHEKIIASRQF